MMCWLRTFLLIVVCSFYTSVYAYSVSDVDLGYWDPDGYGWQDRDEVFYDYFDTNSERLVVFSPRKNAWAAYDEFGDLLRTGVASGGADWCSDVGRPCRTPEGTFQVHQKRGINCRSGKYPRRANGQHGGAAMPMCMFFHGGYAIHGSDNVPSDYNASHGCVRVDTQAAIWLSRDFVKIGTKVKVLPYRKK